MKIKVYASKEDQYKAFLKSVSIIKNEFDFQFIQISDVIDEEQHPHFSIFLLQAHYANGQSLHQQIQYLKEKGAHDQNFLFIIIDKEKITRNQQALVETDLYNSLSAVISSPQVQTASLIGYASLLHNDYSFMYWDERLNQYRTLKQLNTEADKEYFQTYIGVQTLIHFIKENWVGSEYLLTWSAPGKTVVIYQRLPKEIVEEMRRIEKIELVQVEDQKQFERLCDDHQVLTMVY